MKKIKDKQSLKRVKHTISRFVMFHLASISSLQTGFHTGLRPTHGAGLGEDLHFGSAEGAAVLPVSLWEALPLKGSLGLFLRTFKSYKLTL